MKKRAPDLRELDHLQIDARVTDARLRDMTACDEGTCVMGAGIAVIEPETYARFILVPAPFQGNVGSYRALKPTLLDLQKRYPKFQIEWYDGLVD